MKIFLFLISINLFLCNIIHATNKNHVIGYLPSWKPWDLNSIDVSKLTAIHFSFLKIDIDTSQIVFGDNSSEYTFEEDLVRLQYLKKINPNLDLIISIGGAKADGFSQISSSKKSRNIFAKSIIKFIERYNFDGVDLDWEFPVHGGWDSIQSSPKDKENLVLLVEEIRSQLNVLEQIYDKRYSLSLAVGAGDWVIEGIDFKALELNVDYFAVMTYNFAGVFSEITSSHVNLYRGETYWSINDTIELIMNTGINSDLLLLGISFYGRYHANVDSSSKDGLYQKFSGNNGKQSVSYEEIKNEYLNNPNYNVFFDKETKALHLYSKEEKSFISYHDKKSIKEMSKYAKEKALGGVFIWELTQDDNQGSLLKYTHKYFHG